MVFVFRIPGPFGSPTQIPIEGRDEAQARDNLVAKTAAASKATHAVAPVVKTFPSMAHFLAANPALRHALASYGCAARPEDN